jgi:hypothetical protein
MLDHSQFIEYLEDGHRCEESIQMTDDGYPCDATPESVADQWLYFDKAR